jgi:DGQHR domain-containing protein
MKRKSPIRRKKITPEERDNKNFEKKVIEIFTKSGFESVKSEGKQITFSFPESERTGELDFLFIKENVVVVCESTHVKKVGDHLSKKLILAGLILEHPEHFVEEAKEAFPNLKDITSKYTSSELEVRYLYFSRNEPNQEYCAQAEKLGVKIVKEPLVNYFHSLTKLVEKTAVYEILKFIGVKYEDYGANRVKSAGSTDNIYSGFLLPHQRSFYGDEYQVVTFYADPQSLLEKSYVLRRNGWQDPNSSYQRILESRKIKSMRKYLSDEQRVYINNLIVALPSDIKVHGIPGEEIKSDHTRRVTVHIPQRHNVVGIIDGQHRLFSYYEGSDTHEEKIKLLRSRQNLLVTAIIHPRKKSEQEKSRYEAKLFLEINSSQTKVKSEVTHAIEVIVRPFSKTAIAKSVVSRLAESGPLKGTLEEHAFDKAGKIKTTSLISYGIAPLVKLSGEDSLFSIWNDSGDREKILNHEDYKLLDEYKSFCVEKINTYLLAFKENLSSIWKVGDENKALTPTSLNGMISCMRHLIREGKSIQFDSIKENTSDISGFDFKKYKSSQWNNMGKEIYKEFFLNKG